MPVSASLIDFSEFSRKNFVKLDQALRYVPGVNITMDQVSIRGSSGYSRGAGTRVLVAIDGVPLYTGDTGEIIWEIVPVTELKRVEIIKGASSSLYGSTAIGGVINVITKEISSNPVTFFKSYIGFYDKPAHDEWNWSGERRPFNGLTLSHSNRLGDLGISASLTRTENMSYRENDWQKRYSGYLKAKYNFNEMISLTLFGTGFVQERSTFNFWKDSQNALTPPDDDIGQLVNSERFIFGLIFDDIINENVSFNIKSNLYKSFWKDQSESLNSSTSNLFRNEIQGNFKLAKNMLLISGAEIALGEVTSNIFSNPTSKSLGFYSQLEYEFNFPLKLSLGARYDFSKLDTLESSGSFSPKLGANLKLSENTILRASVAKGFRAPSLAEAYTSTTASGVRVKPNPLLKSETNYSAELGINQNFFGFINADLAVFQSEYYDLIEAGIDPADGQVFFNNVGRARIQGSEFNLVLDLNMIDSKLSMGHTYLWARDVNQNKSLKYRPRHLLYTRYQFNKGIFEFGADFRYWSRVEEIDFELISLGLVPNGDKRVPVYVLDISCGLSLYSLNLPARIYLNAENILNYNYIEMIGNISPIRNYSLSLELVF